MGRRRLAEVRVLSSRCARQPGDRSRSRAETRPLILDPTGASNRRYRGHSACAPGRARSKLHRLTTRRGGVPPTGEAVIHSAWSASCLIASLALTRQFGGELSPGERCCLHRRDRLIWTRGVWGPLWRARLFDMPRKFSPVFLDLNGV